MDVSHSVFDQPIIITYRPPIWLLPLIALAYAVGLTCLFQTSIPHTIKLIMAAIVSIKFGLWIKKVINIYIKKNRLILNKNDEWYVIYSDMRPLRAKLNSVSVFSTELIFLRLQDNNNSLHDFILDRTTMGGDTLRRLRVRLYYPRPKKAGHRDQ
jgi:hypothetical protein